jgi:2-succinyl-5-enolpyruvyl-6-hydroxy-3-cyclohexene-1-carboxylate synthase
MPIRDLDQAMRPRRGLRLLANRGASGIDGLVSTAVGAALAHNGPSYALLGDLTFLHDQNGLILGPREPRPDLCLVVVNNDGGGIFSLLPQAGLTDPFERVFGTPHGVDLAYAAAATGTPHTLLSSADDLPKAIRGEGLRMVEVRTERAENARLHVAMREAAQAAIRSLLSTAESAAPLTT